MGLFNIFRKRENVKLEANLSFEELLKKSITEPAYRPEFYERILTENVVVITLPGDLPDGIQVAQKDMKIHLQVLNDGKVPVFTSTDRIFDNGIIKQQVSFMELMGKDLLNLQPTLRSC